MRNEPVPGFRITDLTVFTTIGADDEEGIPAFAVDTGLMPMVAADIRRLGQLRTIADEFRATGMVVTERHFYPAELTDALADALVQLASTMYMTHAVISRAEVDALLLRYREAKTR